jgi:hypothetical protein
MLLRLGVVLPVSEFVVVKAAIVVDEAAELPALADDAEVASSFESVSSIWDSSPELDAPMLLIDIADLLFAAAREMQIDQCGNAGDVPIANTGNRATRRHSNMSGTFLRQNVQEFPVVELHAG